MSRQDKIICVMGIKVAILFALLLIASWQSALWFAGGSAAFGLALYLAFVWLPEWRREREFKRFARDMKERHQ